MPPSTEKKKHVGHTFHVGWEINFYNFTVEAKDRLEVGLDYVARKIGDDDDLRI